MKSKKDKRTPQALKPLPAIPKARIEVEAASAAVQKDAVISQPNAATDAKGSASPQPPTATQRAEEIYRDLYKFDETSYPRDSVGVAVIAKGESVPLSAPQLAKYMLLVWQTLSEWYSSTEIRKQSLQEFCERILYRWKRNAAIPQFYSSAEKYAYSAELFKFENDFAGQVILEPTVEGWRVIDAFLHQLGAQPALSPGAPQARSFAPQKELMRAVHVSLPQVYEVIGYQENESKYTNAKGEVDKKLRQEARDLTIKRWAKAMKDASKSPRPKNKPGEVSFFTIDDIIEVLCEKKAEITWTHVELLRAKFLGQQNDLSK